MYVIVEINGQQFKAEEGKKLFVHHMRHAESGATVEFDKVLTFFESSATSPESTAAFFESSVCNVSCREIGRASCRERV